MPNNLTQTSVFNIDNVLAEISQRGLLRPCRFLVSIVMTSAMTSLNSDLANMSNAGTTMSFWCEQASLPGAMIDIAPFRRYGYGPMENKPYGARFVDIPLVFRADATGMVHNFLHTWQRLVVDYNYDDTMVSTNPGTGGMPWEVGYKDDYATTVVISVFDDAAGQIQDSSILYDNQNLGGLPSIQIFLRDAYPNAVVDVPLSWGARGDYMKIGCTLTYFSWWTKMAQSGSNSQTTGPSSGGPG